MMLTGACSPPMTHMEAISYPWLYEALTLQMTELIKGMEDPTQENGNFHGNGDPVIFSVSAIKSSPPLHTRYLGNGS